MQRDVGRMVSEKLITRLMVKMVDVRKQILPGYVLVALGSNIQNVEMNMSSVGSSGVVYNIFNFVVIYLRSMCKETDSTIISIIRTS